MAKTLPDPVPLGVAGIITISRQQYIALVEKSSKPANVLLDDAERISYLALRLSESLGRPLTAPGSEGLAQLALECFREVDVLPAFAEKALETLKDGNYHSRTAISPDEPRIAVSFIAWNGTHREVQSQRVGNYLGSLFAAGRQLVKRGIQLVGYLEIDAYLRDNVDPDDPGAPLDESFQVDVEYSYMPGEFLGSTSAASADFPKVAILNPDLCTHEEKQLIMKFLAP